jgi:hypothetical protein
MHAPDDELWDRLGVLEMLSIEIAVEPDWKLATDNDTVLFELHQRG